MMIWLFLCITLLYIWFDVSNSSTSSIPVQSHFSECDENGDHHLDEAEFVQCFERKGHSLQERVVNSDLAKLFVLLDENKDGKVSTAEYATVQRKIIDRNSDPTHGEDELITLRLKNGTIQEIPKGMLYNFIEENMKGFKRVDGNQLMRETEKSVKLADLPKDDPQLSKYITIAKWAHGQLLQHNVSQGVMKGLLLEDIPPAPATSTSSSSEEEFRPFTVTMIIKVEESSGVIQQYEVSIDYHPWRYEPPYLAITSLHLLEEQGGGKKENQDKKRLILPLPPAKQRDYQRLLHSLGRRYGLAVGGLTLLLVCLLTGCCSLMANIKEKIDKID